MAEDARHSIAVFPFLKTKEPVSIGRLTFRPTDDTSGLAPAEAALVADVSSMLFLRNDLRIRSASCAVIPFVDLTSPSPDVAHLSDVQAVVAYLYNRPHEVFGDPFLSTEYASMVVFSPGTVFADLVEPNVNVEATRGDLESSADESGRMAGYEGLYDLRHHFWVTRGSRVYGPLPHLILNKSQDLGEDVRSALSSHRPDYGLLRLIREPATVTSGRRLTAVRWFNEANRESSSGDASLVSLAIAFESLLGLPRSEKSDRLVDAIALLLGRVPRLDVWAQQFYDERSNVVHEGRAEQMNFVARDSGQKVSDPAHQSLLSYGRQVFRLCLGTLLAGSELARQAGLEEKLVTNQQRFESICRILADENVSSCERLASARQLVDVIERYRFVPGSGLKLSTMLGVARHAAQALVACDSSLSAETRRALQAMAEAQRTEDHLAELDALHTLHAVLPENLGGSDHVTTVQELVDVVWHYVFHRYFWLKKREPVQQPLS